MKLFESDGLPKKDRLGYRKFARGLATGFVAGLDPERESLAVGINGPWGCGKSTFLHYLETELKKKLDKKYLERYRIIHFNPWLFSGQEELQLAFLTQLYGELNPGEGYFKKIAQKLGESLKGLSILKAIPGADKFYDGANNILESISRTSPLPQIKQEINDIIQQERLAIFIIIDDIDRLQPREITEIFQLVKLNLNFNNSYFLLAYDREAVNNALSKHLKIDAERYLEKITQVDYTMPQVLSEHIKELFMEQFTRLLKSNRIPLDMVAFDSIWEYDGLKMYFLNLRSVKRFINGLSLRLPGVKKEVNVHHFVILESIRVFDYKSFEEIRRVCMKAAQRSLTVISQVDFKFSSRFSEVTKDLISAIVEDAKLHAFNGSNKSLFDPKYYDVYFGHQLPSRSVTEKEYVDFVQGRDSRYSLLATVYKNGRLDGLLMELCNQKRIEITCQSYDPELIKSLMFFFESNWAKLPERVERVLNIIQMYVGLSSDADRSYLEVLQYLSPEGEFRKARFLLVDSILSDEENDFQHVFPVGYSSELKAKAKKMLSEHLIYYIKDVGVQFRTSLDKDLDGTYSRRFLYRFKELLPKSWPELFDHYLNKRRWCFKGFCLVFIYRNSLYPTRSPLLNRDMYAHLIESDSMEERLLSVLDELKMDLSIPHDQSEVYSLLHELITTKDE